jgi:hypothetical protein
MSSRKALLPIALGALLVAGCGYIVTPEDESSPTPAVAGHGWDGVATKVEAASAGGVHIDITIRNDTGDWSAMTVDTTAAAATLVAGDGSSTPCSTVFVGTGGNSLAPGFQVRGYTAGTKAAPVTQLLYAECPGSVPAAGARLDVPYTYTTGPYAYYSPATPVKATLEVKLDSVATDLKYPIAQPVDGLIQKADASIEAINKCVLTLKSVTRTATGIKFAWHTENPTDYPTYVHIGSPPVVGSDGVIYGFYKSPHLAITPITPGKQAADWTTDVTVPADITGLYILLSVESLQQKYFISHVLDITDK